MPLENETHKNSLADVEMKKDDDNDDEMLIMSSKKDKKLTWCDSDLCVIDESKHIQYLCTNFQSLQSSNFTHCRYCHSFQRHCKAFNSWFWLLEDWCKTSQVCCYFLSRIWYMFFTWEFWFLVILHCVNSQEPKVFFFFQDNWHQQLRCTLCDSQRVSEHSQCHKWIN